MRQLYICQFYKDVARQAKPGAVVVLADVKEHSQVWREKGNAKRCRVCLFCVSLCTFGTR